MASGPDFPFSYALKADDDVYINLGQLMREIGGPEQSRPPPPPLLLGNLICGALPIRDPANKYFAPSDSFSGRVYPNYLSGTAYLMSTTAAAELFRVAVKRQGKIFKYRH